MFTLTSYLIGCAVSLIATVIIMFSGKNDGGFYISLGDIVISIVLVISSWFTLAIFAANMFSDSKIGQKVVYPFKKKEEDV